MATLPLVVTKAGLQPQAPDAILAQLIAAVTAQRPGYTANLPGSLVEDISSTDVASIVLCDQALVELVNSLTPFGANAFLLNQLGQMTGVPLGEPTQTSVFEVFTGPPGFIIPKGFTVSDGTFQYVVQDGGAIASGGSTDQLFCLAALQGSWVVPPNTVTQIVTSLPDGVSVTCTNPTDGVPGNPDEETQEAYRTRVLQAGLAVSIGMGTTVKTLLSKVSGVQTRLISVQQQEDGGWIVICGGGDPYQVAYAIYSGLLDISTLVESTITAVSITKANPGVIVFDLNHGLTNGDTFQINGATGMTEINGIDLSATVVDEKTVSCGVNTSSFGVYTGNGVLSPNNRNISASLLDYPDSYLVHFVNPPQQSVAITLTWNTTAENIVAPAAVQQLGAPALVDYVNSIPVGQPINLFELQAVFQAAVADIVPPAQLTRMVFSVSINGVGTAPSSGTGIIAGDPQSYFETDTTQITITKG